MDVIQD